LLARKFAACKTGHLNVIIGSRSQPVILLNVSHYYLSCVCQYNLQNPYLISLSLDLVNSDQGSTAKLTYRTTGKRNLIIRLSNRQGPFT